MEKLNNIFIKYGTDKSDKHNGYTKYYEKYFDGLRNKNLKILEIGIFRPPLSWVECQVAASLKSWSEYFVNSEIIGADIEDFSDVNESRVSTIIINQEKREDLQKIVDLYGDNFDIIIDDGGHTMLQQQVTFGKMFPNLKSGGIYVIEDLITSYIRPGEYNPTSTLNTTLEVLKSLQLVGSFESDFITESEKKYLLDNIKSIIIENGTHGPISFIYKK
jgi:hypothetical protein